MDELKLLQVGIALSSGPAGRRCPVAWQFNLRGFDARRDPHAAASVAMLRAQGMDLGLLREFGAAPEAFAAGFFRSGLGCGRLTWAAFSGSYDFAFLAKVLGGGRPLPATVEGFLAHVRHLFGPAVLDVKRLARFCGKGGCAGGWIRWPRRSASTAPRPRALRRLRQLAHLRRAPGNGGPLLPGQGRARARRCD